MPVERAIPLCDNNGIVGIGDNKPISDGGERVVGINPAQIPEERIQMIVNDSQVGFLHTEPLNERNSNLMIGTPESERQTMIWSPNPSGFDEVNYKPKDGYHIA